VLQAELSLSELQQIRLSFAPSLLGPRDIVSLCSQRGVAVSVSSFGGFLMASRLLKKQQRETRKHLTSFLLCLALFSPVLLVGMVLPMFTASNSLVSVSVAQGLDIQRLVLWIFTTPIEFVIGWQFHKKAIESVYTGSLGMDFLVSTGTLAAYFFSVGCVVESMVVDKPSLGGDNYFGTSAMLITAVLFGKFLETYAKGKTASAIHKLSSLRSKFARLVVASSSSVEGEGVGATDQIIDSSLIQMNDIIRLVTGESIPADGELLLGSNNLGVDESMMTVGHFFIISYSFIL
jgi:Cu+-exporting ATPase